MKAVRLAADELSDATREALHRHSCFASPGFANIWESVGGRSVCWSVKNDKGLVALLPAIEFGRKPLLRLQAMPDGCYASLVMIGQDVSVTNAASVTDVASITNVTDAASVSNVSEYEKVSSVILEAIADYGYARAFIVDQQNFFMAAEKFELQACETSLIDISDSDWKPAQKKLRTEIRATLRRGGKVIPFVRDRHLESFLVLLHSIKQRAQRFPKNPEKFYSALANLAETDSRIRWLVIEHEQKVVASLVSVVERDMVLAWHGCIDRNIGTSLKPMNLLVYTIIALMKSEGVHYFNFGSTPPGATGVEAFKKKWGGEQYTYRTLVYRAGLGRLR